MKHEELRHENAIILFDEMYSQRTLRDSAAMLAGDAERNGRIREWRIFSARSLDRNKASNVAMMQLLDLGYSAYRDEARHYIPTLTHGGKVIAYWHGFANIEVVSK